jgi:signal transduction histidine kinase
MVFCMSWVTIIWSVLASAGLTLGAVHLLVWTRKPAASAHLFYFLTAVGAAGMSACELWLMHATTVQEAAIAVRWIHIPVWLVVVSLVMFVRRYLRAGRSWLAWTVCGVRTLSLFLNFLLSPNLNYREIVSLQHTELLGESISVVVGLPSPWMLVGQGSLLLLVIFLLDATVQVWRRGERRHAVAVGGTLVFFVLSASVESAIVLWGLISAPVVPSLFYQALVAVMGSELSWDVIRAARLSDELREDRQRIQLAATAAKLALWTWDIRRDRIRVTPEGRTLTTVPQDGAITLDRFLASLHADDREAVRQAVRRALLDGGEYRAEYRVPLSDGAVRWVVGRGKVEFDADGQPSRLRGVSLDVTDRKLAEQRAQSHREEVAHLSRVTTLGEMSASLAHELSQPLATILSNARAAELQLQRPEPDLDEVRAILTDIRDADLRASEIIERLRAFLRRHEMEKEPLDVAQLVGDTLRLISGEAARRGSKVSAEIPPDLPRINGDRIHLQQVLVNLLINGMDAMSGCPSVERRLVIRAGLPDPTTVEIAVSDAGIGIPPADLARVLEPFHTTKPHGLGLGLAICRSIVEAHGGSIFLENNSDRGTSARVRFPLGEVVAVAHEALIENPKRSA